MTNLIGMKNNSFKNEYLKLNSNPTEQTICHDDSLRVDYETRFNNLSAKKDKIVANLKRQTNMTKSEIDLVETEKELAKLKSELN